MVAATQEQFLRKASLLVAAQTGEGIDLSNMHFKFLIENEDAQAPNSAVIRVFNLNPETVRKIAGRQPVEFTTVKVQAGYERAAFGSIFQGTIQQFELGRESPVDTYLDIIAADGDYQYTNGTVSASLAKGSTADQRIKVATGQMGLKDGYMTALTGTELFRGKVMFGMGRDVLAYETRSQNATWSIQDGKVNVVALDKYIPGTAFEINALTGMIGIPSLTEQGVQIRALINPNVKVGYLIKIDNTSLNLQLQASAIPTVKGQWKTLFHQAATNADGIYRIYSVDYSGDTRGNDWYMDIIALAVDDSTKKVQPYGITPVPTPPVQ